MGHCHFVLVQQRSEPLPQDVVALALGHVVLDQDAVLLAEVLGEQLDVPAVGAAVHFVQVAAAAVPLALLVLANLLAELLALGLERIALQSLARTLGLALVKPNLPKALLNDVLGALLLAQELLESLLLLLQDPLDTARHLGLLVCGLGLLGALGFPIALREALLGLAFLGLLLARLARLAGLARLTGLARRAAARESLPKAAVGATVVAHMPADLPCQLAETALRHTTVPPRTTAKTTERAQDAVDRELTIHDTGALGLLGLLGLLHHFLGLLDLLDRLDLAGHLLGGTLLQAMNTVVLVDPLLFRALDTDKP
mmetsp:Transcript_41411/g.89733  ORF Transcript_41411/g.89733 Transcript_41411/m.89733 type:complete len:314 (-) Transcript_41411:210-1151(-)